jgi:eukaryotic-like serine/threonine-protein kinase
VKGLAVALRVQGLLPEAWQAAQRGLSEYPFDAEMYAEAELTLIGMNRYDDALQLESQAARVGVMPGGYALTAGYLDGREDIVAARVRAMQDAGVAGGTEVRLGELYRYGIYLDDAGKMNAGLALWRTAADRAGNVPELVSAQASMLAQGALDRALAENCNVALAMVDEVKNLTKGPVASFDAGMAAALCGDQPYAEKTAEALQQSYPQNTAVTKYYVPELQAAAEIGVNQPEKALDSLVSLRQYDQISLTPYLRGMADAAMGQSRDAIADFQTVVQHRGMAMLLGGDVYPMAELGAARAYRANRDTPDSAAAYQRFLVSWAGADRGQTLMTEALVRTSSETRRH